ncbi:hypothetical protein I79_001622 [Cricetulus griseus]|uniref:Uncharacterized protein n=1 Tax=Cricetulus griseus TaxID=10029 RepID=G3GV91_CRIGR|nr:hypothetical protein I79_001622 [Cricetulus griseus]
MDNQKTDIRHCPPCPQLQDQDVPFRTEDITVLYSQHSNQPCQGSENVFRRGKKPDLVNGGS